MTRAATARAPTRHEPALRSDGPLRGDRPSRLDRLGRYAARAAALLGYAGALALVYLILVPVLPDGVSFWRAQPAPPEAAAPPAQTAEPRPLPPRPETVPARIPAWAWAMHTWHLTPSAERGARPADAPRRLPPWYWEWRQWRLELAKRPAAG